MPNNHTLRIHLEYDLLYLAELRALLTDFERAYNLLEHAEDGHRRRVSLTDRLTVKTIETGKSLTVILVGGIALLTLAGATVKKIADAREAVWKSEEAKWKAKTAKLDFQERERAIEKERREELPAPARAIGIVQNRVSIIKRTGHVRTIQIEIDGEDVKWIGPPNRNPLPDKGDK